MRGLGRFLVGTALIIAPVAVRAADLPVKGPIAPLWTDWTGFFVGGNFGIGGSRKRFYDIFGPRPDFALDADAKISGALGGFQAGYNYQFDKLVLGIEGNFQWSGIRGDFGCFSFGNQQCSASAEWFATLTGRAGLAFGPSLWYATAGAAWTRDTVTNIATTPACVPTGGAVVCSAPGDLFSGNQIRPGWTVGAGMEYAFSPHWSMKFQYNFMNFGQRSIILTDGIGGSFPEAVKQTVQFATAGFAYRFGSPGVTGTVAPLFLKAPAASDQGVETARAFVLADTGPYSVDTVTGALVALSKDLDTSGPRLWITGAAGLNEFPSGNTWIRDINSGGEVLAGYAFEGDNYSINLLAGGNAENHMLSAFDANDPVHGTQGGIKVRADVHYNPTAQTLVAAESEYSTAFQTYFTSAKFGVDVTNGKQVFFGPEIFAFGDARFDQQRIGMHLSELQFLGTQFDISAGYAHDSVVGNGFYGHLEVSRNF